MELVSKRVLGYVNWRRNRATSHTSEYLDTLVADLKREKPDHIAVTGDIVNLTLEAELQPALAWLESLGAPDAVSVVPGNHDAYVPGARDRALALWQAFMASDGVSLPGPRFPYHRQRDGIAIVGLSSARASAPFMATGHFSASQARDLADTLAHSGAEGLCRVVLIHHPPYREKNDWYRRLVGASHLRRALREAGAELVLHGHTHRDQIVWLDGRDGPVPVVGVPSASNGPGRHRPAARYNLFEFDRAGAGWRITQRERGLTLPGEPVSEISCRVLEAPAETLKGRARA